MSDQIDYRTVLITWYDQPEDTVEEVLVGVSDGTIDLSETEQFDFDERIFFYFHDEAEFESAKLSTLPEVGFRIVGDAN